MQGGLDLGLQPSLLCVAAGLLQPAVLPDGDHAEHGQEERAAAGQDVPGLRGDQEADQGGDHLPTQGRGQCPRSVHGGKISRHLYSGSTGNISGGEVGCTAGIYSGVKTEGVVSPHASHLHQGNHSG